MLTRLSLLFALLAGCGVGVDEESTSAPAAAAQQQQTLERQGNPVSP